MSNTERHVNRPRRTVAARCDACGAPVRLEVFHVARFPNATYRWVRPPSRWVVLVGGPGLRVRCPRCFDLLH
jgi:hypothetical protein